MAQVSAEFLKGRVRYLATSLSPHPEKPLLAQEFTVLPGKGKESGDSPKYQFLLRGRVGREGHPEDSQAKPHGDGEGRVFWRTLQNQGWRRASSTGGPTGGCPSPAPHPTFSCKLPLGRGKQSHQADLAHLDPDGALIVAAPN